MWKILLIITLIQFPFLSIGQCDKVTDSLVLVDLYNHTDGSNWLNPWNLNEPISTWYGVTLNSNGCVQCIDLDGRLDCSGYAFNNLGNNLYGQIPESLGNLSQIEHISFGNNFLIDTIPSSLGQLQNLNEIILRYNFLTGSIPAELGNLENLELLNLTSNLLTGTIPSEIGMLEQLSFLFLFDNNLSGEIPSTFSNLELFAFGAARNELSGEIPAFLGEIIIDRLELQNNHFIGCFPEKLRMLCDGEDVNFSDNLALPWEGDFEQFCTTTNQIMAHCEDGLPYTFNFINADCECVAILTTTSESDAMSVLIFPNPVNDILFIQKPERLNNLRFILFTTAGRKMAEFSSDRYDMTTYQSGIYFLLMINQNSGIRQFVKILKQ